MSALTPIHEQHAATKQRLAVARDGAASRLSAHERAAEEKATQFAEIEAAYLANATSEALGLEPMQELPDAISLEKLRADVAVAEPVRRQLAANLEKCEVALRGVETKHKAAVADYLRESVVAPALTELEEAFDKLRDAAINVMAAHYLAYRKYNDRALLPNRVEELHGPVAEWLSDLRMMQWPSHPYEIRPDWLPRHSRFYPDEMAGVAERTNQLLAAVEGVPS